MDTLLRPSRIFRILAKSFYLGDTKHDYNSCHTISFKANQSQLWLTGKSAPCSFLVLAHPSLQPLTPPYDIAKLQFITNIIDQILTNWSNYNWSSQAGQIKIIDQMLTNLDQILTIWTKVIINSITKARVNWHSVSSLFFHFNCFCLVACFFLIPWILRSVKYEFHRLFLSLMINYNAHKR